MLHIEQEVAKVSESRRYARFGFSHANWKLSLSKEYSRSQFLKIRNKIYFPTRVLYVTRSFGMRLQAPVPKWHFCYCKILNRNLIWRIFIVQTHPDIYQQFSSQAMFEIHSKRKLRQHLHTSVQSSSIVSLKSPFY